MAILESKASQPAIGNILLTAGFGTVFGLLFGLPPAIAICATGVPWFPWGLAASIPGLIVADVLAYLVARFVFGLRLFRGRRVADTAAARRLGDAVEKLERFRSERKRRHDPGYEKRTEDRIIWNELLDLELQDIDQQINRITGSNPSKGGPS